MVGVTGSNPVSRTIRQRYAQSGWQAIRGDEETATSMMKFFYTYVLQCADGRLYIGYTQDLRARMREHQSGHVPTTRIRLPVTLVYYEACLDEAAAVAREKQLKTGFGRAYLKRRLG